MQVPKTWKLGVVTQSMKMSTEEDVAFARAVEGSCCMSKPSIMRKEGCMNDDCVRSGLEVIHLQGVWKGKAEEESQRTTTEKVVFGVLPVQEGSYFSIKIQNI